MSSTGLMYTYLPVLSAKRCVTKPNSSLISDVRQTAGISRSSSYLSKDKTERFVLIFDLKFLDKNDQIAYFLTLKTETYICRSQEKRILDKNLKISKVTNSDTGIK